MAFGNPATSLDYDLALDTTTDWTWIPDATCPAACDAFIDNAAAWTGYSAVAGGTATATTKTLNYMGSGTITGKIYNGVEVAANADLWVPMPVLSITSFTGTWSQNYHGILGLNLATPNGGSLWVEQL